MLLSGCRDSFAAFGTGAHARASADGLFGALTERHYDLLRNAKYDYARVRIMRGALSPSRVFDDPDAWTGSSGGARILETWGYFGDGQYHMSSRTSVPAPARLADGRHVTTLGKLSDTEYRWDTSVDYAVGPVRPADIALVLSRLMASGEGRTEHTARADLLSAAPRTSAALGTAFSLDTIRPVALADGTTAVTLTMTVHSEALKHRFPAFSDYVRRYVDPARMRFLVTDRSGAPFVDISAKERVLTVRVRTQRGHLVPLSGAPRAMPDSLVLAADFKMRVKLFTVGFHDLQMEFVNAAREGEREWVFTGRREPQWDLPLFAGRLLRAPLRRPFAGEGVLFRIGVRAGDGNQPTVLFRQVRLFVQESSILNFLNSLSSTAMDDLNPAVEREQNIWLRELFSAMRDDARAVIGPG